MSISTTSGPVRRTTSTASRPSPGVPDHLAAARLQHQLQPGPHQLLVVGDHHPGHGARRRRSGMSDLDHEPVTGAAPRSSVPPSSATRSDIPWPARARNRCRCAGPTGLAHRIRDAGLGPTRHEPGRSVGVLERVGERLLHDAVRRDVDATGGGSSGRSSRRPPRVPLSRNASTSVGHVGRRRAPAAARARRRRRGSGAAAGRSRPAPAARSRPPTSSSSRGPVRRSMRTRSWAAAVCTTIALTEWAITSCSSRAIRSRSSRTAWSRSCSDCWASCSDCSASLRRDPAEDVRRDRQRQDEDHVGQVVVPGSKPKSAKTRRQRQHQRDQGSPPRARVAAEGVDRRACRRRSASRRRPSGCRSAASPSAPAADTGTATSGTETAEDQRRGGHRLQPDRRDPAVGAQRGQLGGAQGEQTRVAAARPAGRSRVVHGPRLGRRGARGVHPGVEVVRPQGDDVRLRRPERLSASPRPDRGGDMITDTNDRSAGSPG